MPHQGPYAGQYGHYDQPQYEQPQYGQPQYGQPQYGQQYEPDNPYPGSQQQPYQTYEQGGYDNGGGYRDDPDPALGQRQESYSAGAPQKSIDERSRFDAGEFTPSPRGPKTASNLRQYRMDFRGHLWTRGGRGRCIGRFFCCTVGIIVLLLVIILGPLVLWLRPPSIDFGGVAPVASGSTVQVTGDGVIINMGVDISVDNPNFFAVNFKKITADISYRLNGVDTAIGNGVANNIMLKSNAQTNFTFPFAIDYSKQIDPNGEILVDIATKCGIIGTSKTDLTVDYKITLALQILFVTVNPTVSNTFSFPCPLTKDEIQGLLPGGLGGLI